jgi:hypothetical protein
MSDLDSSLTDRRQTEMLGARRGSGVWFNRRDSKSRVPSLAPGVRIPPSPPREELVHDCTPCPEER